MSAHEQRADVSQQLLTTTEKAPVSPIRCCWSIRIMLLIFPLLVVSSIIFIGILVWVLNYVNTTVSVSDLATQVQQELASRMMARASGLLNIPPLVADLSAATVALNLFTVTNFTSTRAAAWEYFKTVNTLSFLTFSTLSNTYFGYERTVNNSINLYRRDNFPGIDASSTNGYRIAWQVDQNTGLPRSDWGPIANRTYTPLTRDWFVNTIDSGSSYWSAIYPFTSGTVGLTHARVLRNSTGTIFGVVTADIVLGELNLFLRSIRISENGKAFIVEKNGLLVASSAGSLDDGTLTRLPAANSSDATIAAVAKYLATTYGTFDKIPFNSTKEYFNGVSTFVQVARFTYHSALDWVIVVVVPESDVMSKVYQSTAITMSITGATLLLSMILALVLSLVIGYVISRPLELVSIQMQRVANVDFSEKDKNALSSLFEFLQMENALGQMKKGLVKVKKFVPKLFLKSIKCEKVSEVTLGQSLNRDYTFLYVDFPDFGPYAKLLSSDELLAIINNFLAAVGPIIRKKDGFIVRHFAAGMLLAFPDAKKAISAATAIFANGGLVVGKPNSDQKLTMNMCMALHTGAVTAGTVGEDENMDMTLVSEQVALVSFLYIVAKRFRCGLVASKSSLAGKGLAKASSTRLVGTFKIRNDNNALLEVLEVINVDKNKSEKSVNYEKASSILFGGKGSFHDAIAALEEICKQNPADSLASAHLQLSKNLASKNQNHSINLSIQEGLKDESILAAFEQFCKQELNSENINLWKELQLYRAATTNEERHGIAKKMYDEYIDMNAPQTVNIRDTTRKQIATALTTPSLFVPEFLDPLFVELQVLMVDPWKRYKATEPFLTAFFSSKCRLGPALPSVDLDLGMTFTVDGSLTFDGNPTNEDTVQINTFRKNSKASLIV